MLKPQPAVDRVQTPRPRAISLKALTCLLASAKIGDDTRRPTCAVSPYFQAGILLTKASDVQLMKRVVTMARFVAHQESCRKVAILGQAQPKVTLHVQQIR